MFSDAWSNGLIYGKQQGATSGQSPNNITSDNPLTCFRANHQSNQFLQQRLYVSVEKCSLTQEVQGLLYEEQTNH